LNSYVDSIVIGCRRHVEYKAESASRKISPPFPAFNLLAVSSTASSSSSVVTHIEYHLVSEFDSRIELAVASTIFQLAVIITKAKSI
jgi:hypothetical protein